MVRWDIRSQRSSREPRPHTWSGPGVEECGALVHTKKVLASLWCFPQSLGQGWAKKCMDATETVSEQSWKCQQCGRQSSAPQEYIFFVIMLIFCTCAHQRFSTHLHISEGETFHALFPRHLIWTSVATVCSTVRGACSVWGPSPTAL